MTSERRHDDPKTLVRQVDAPDTGTTWSIEL
jgi:hypothetical protein